MATPGTPVWHSSKDVLKELQIFHQKKATEPEGMREAREYHNTVVTRLRERLKGASSQKIQELIFTGSAYEGVKIGSIIEFDVMVKMNGKDIEEELLVEQPGYTLLKPARGKQDLDQFKGLLDDQGYISAQKLARKFHGDLQKVINDTPDFKDKIKLKTHGTVATQMDVHKAGGQKWYEVDMVPCFEIPGQPCAHHYVAKPQSDPTSQGLQTSVWRRSFSIEEKTTMSGIDMNNACRKQCLRVLKAMREKEACLRALTSYHFKTLLLHENRKPGLTWNADDLLLRVMGLLKSLVEALEKKKLPNYFIPQMNLVKDLITKPKAVDNIKDRVTKLMTKEPKFREFVKTSA